jgi:hypothetical protein
MLIIRTTVSKRKGLSDRTARIVARAVFPRLAEALSGTADRADGHAAGPARRPTRVTRGAAGGEDAQARSGVERRSRQQGDEIVV